MKLKKIPGRLFLFIIAALLANAPACVAEGTQCSPGAIQYTDLDISPFKGPSTAPVVITLFSDFQ